MKKYPEYKKSKVDNQFQSKLGFLRCSKICVCPNLMDTNKYMCPNLMNKNNNQSSITSKSQYLNILSTKECNSKCEKTP